MSSLPYFDLLFSTSKKLERGVNLDSSHHFVDCPAIGTHVIQRNDRSRIVTVDHTTVLSFTPTEYRLLVPLLSGQMTGDNELAQAATGCGIEQWKKANLKRYIDKIRYKVRSVGLDVGRISGHGYILLASKVTTLQ